MEEKVMEIIKDVLLIDNIDTNLSQKECDAWDSLAHLRIAVEIEDQFGISLEPEDIMQMNSIKNIISVLERRMV